MNPTSDNTSSQSCNNCDIPLQPGEPNFTDNDGQRWCKACTSRAVQRFNERVGLIGSRMASGAVQGQPVAPTPAKAPKAATSHPKANKGPIGIPFGQYLTCSNCGGKCTNHHIDHTTGDIWCPSCVQKHPEEQSKCGQCGNSSHEMFQHSTGLFCEECFNNSDLPIREFSPTPATRELWNEQILAGKKAAGWPDEQ